MHNLWPTFKLSWEEFATFQADCSLWPFCQVTVLVVLSSGQCGSLCCCTVIVLLLPAGEREGVGFETRSMKALIDWYNFQRVHFRQKSEWGVYYWVLNWPQCALQCWHQQVWVGNVKKFLRRSCCSKAFSILPAPLNQENLHLEMGLCLSHLLEHIPSKSSFLLRFL